MKRQLILIALLAYNSNYGSTNTYPTIPVQMQPTNYGSTGYQLDYANNRATQVEVYQDALGNEQINVRQEPIFNTDSDVKSDWGL